MDNKEEKQQGLQGQQEETYQTQLESRKENKTIKGILFGIFGTLCLGCLLVYGYCRTTGKQIVIMSNESNGISQNGLIDQESYIKLTELKAYIDAYYYDETDEESLKNGLYAGLLSGIGDKYSTYYTAEEYQESQTQTTGQYYGIGAGLSQDSDTMEVTVNRIYEGTPSEEVGLLMDDVILSVDNVDATSMELTELVEMIHGEAGTTVHLEVYRPSNDEFYSMEVERRTVSLPSVYSQMVDDTIGYVQIQSFETDTAHQFETAVTDLADQGMTSLVVDLRYNGGGLLDSAVEILDDVLPEGLLVYTEDKAGNRKEYNSSGDTHMDYPMVVLVNERTASASEIFAGAIKDYEYGTILGTQTFGKGIVQTVFKLADGDAVKLTTAKYFTPNGNYIHGVGIEPDIELEYEYLDPEGTEYDIAYDNQVQKAIEVLHGETE